ncbi:unnamed protein product [Larinioides sclopetarius]|uniref:Uncharacterized protein n=1 Tax=Larinioides sclopetarius TaxID=280406 RepID=A0AAV2B7T7_9ARAC
MTEPTGMPSTPRRATMEVMGTRTPARPSRSTDTAATTAELPSPYSCTTPTGSQPTRLQCMPDLLTIPICIENVPRLFTSLQ